MFMQKRIPLRKCTGCNEMKPKTELIRVVKAPDISDDNINNIKGAVSIDLTYKAPGRGAYVCKNETCLLAAKKARRFERAFGCKISEEIYDELILEISKLKV